MEKRTINILSILYSLFIIIGLSFMVNGDFSLITNSIINILISTISFIMLFFLFKYILILSSKYLDKYKFPDSNPQNKLLILFDKHPILFSIIVMFICWLPYIIAYYPGIINKDNVFQIKQYFGIDNKYSYYVNLIDSTQIITNHHPYFHTILLGTCIKIGKELFSTNFGFFLFTILQASTFIFTLSYSIYYLKKNNINYHYRLILLMIYSFVPFFPFYAITLVKDSLYTCYFLLYLIILHSTLKEGITIKKSIQIIIIAVLLYLFRNNGIYTFLLSFPFLLINNKKVGKYLIIILIVFGSYKTYNNIILPSLKVTPTSIREALSIPFQQTARYINYHEKDLSEKDKKIINNVLNYKKIKKNYKPELSDPVKNTFNKDSSKKDLKAYLGVWFKGLLKHPVTYIEATIGNIYGYFCPLKTNWYIYHEYRTELKEEDNIDYHFNSLETLRLIISGYGVLFPYIPFIGLLANIGINTWLLLFLIHYLFNRKRFKDIICLAPSLITLLVCIASPANTYFRYVLPIMMSNPFLTLLIITKKEPK